MSAIPPKTIHPNAVHSTNEAAAPYGVVVKPRPLATRAKSTSALIRLHTPPPQDIDPETKQYKRCRSFSSVPIPDKQPSPEEGNASASVETTAAAVEAIKQEHLV